MSKNNFTTPQHVALGTTFFIFCVSTVVLGDAGRRVDLWRSIGPGSTTYRSCRAQIEREIVVRRIEAVDASESQGVWSFRFSIILGTANNDADGGEAVRRCRGAGDKVEVETYQAPF